MIESRLPDSPIPLFTKWHFNSRYATLAQRDHALHDLRKSEHSLERFVFEYRASAGK